nr:CHY zinc finger protein [Microbacterium hydrocarbonoxydans]
MDRPIVIGAITVHGLLVDDQTRCDHYCGPLDVIAIRFACCEDWYPCHLCHTALADHEARQWPMRSRATEAVLCGVCACVLTIDGYLAATACPTCAAVFNPGCRLHHELYFD